LSRLWRRIAVLQTRNPRVVLLAFALLAALGAWRASKLKLVTDFADLLPQDQPSVLELRRILARTRGLANVFIVLEDRDPAKLRRIADALVPRLRAVGSPFVESARDGAQEARRFLIPRAGLYMSEQELSDAEERLAEQERAAFRRGIGADLDQDDTETEGAKAQNQAGKDDSGFLSIFKPIFARLGTVDRYPDGYFQGPSRDPGVTAQVIVVKAAIAAGDIDGATATFDRVRAVVDATLAHSPERPARVSYAGDLLTGRAEYDLVRRDVVSVGGLGMIMVLGVVLLFYRTLRALIALGATISVGCATTFGVTQLALGHLNVATAFLLSIVAGNGVNFGIIWLGRFYEERRAGLTLVRAIEVALARTYPATISAAAAAATAYAALAVGRFRGFRHFALIGGTGMVLCWLTTYALLPSVVVLLERRRARSRAHAAAVLRGLGPSRRQPRKAPFTQFERPFAALVGRAPRGTLAVTLALGLVSLVVGVRHLMKGAMEYDLRHLQSSRDTHDDLYRASDIASHVLGHSGSGGMVVLVDRASDAPPLARILRARRDRAPRAQRPFQDVHILDDLVPPDQAAHLARLRALKRKLQRAYDRGAIDDATWKKLAPLFPPPDLTPFSLSDLPPELVEPFTEKDGTEGRVVYIEQTAGESEADLHYLLRLADAFRNSRLPDGRVVYGSGRAVIFADLLHASLVDMPRSVVVSLLLTAMTVVLLFRRPAPVALVLGSLVLALAWVLGTMAVFDVRLSFINFIALPITFGIGVDYPVNLYARYDQDRAAGVLRAMHGAGGPIILCSLTTSLGYIALLRSHNQAVRSLGSLAVLGEASCLTAALLALPAALLLIERWRRAGRATP
jgi:predicted RND superfamily exporter protein